MSTPEALALFAVIGLITFAMRFSFIGLSSRLKLPAWFTEALHFVPPAALSALIWPDLLIGASGVPLGPGTAPKLIAGAVAILCALVTRSVFATLVTAMLSLWIAQAVLG